jgi:basic membrane lipoprotein Med (substrate-binding protein (PBP1-ABC) superfamily)
LFFGGVAAAELAKQQTVALVAGMASAMERAH